MQATRLPGRLGLVIAAATITAFAMVVSAIAAPGPTWTTLAPVPAATEGMQTGLIGNQIIAAYGYSPSGGGDTNLTRIYDIDADTWHLGAAAPLPVRSEGAAATHGGDLYAVGGRPVGVVGNRLERYSVESDTWTTLAPLPTARAGLGAAVVGDAIFAMGGRTTDLPCAGGPLDTVERYDIASDTWTAAAPLPTPLSDVAAIEHGGKIFVFGGCTASGTPVDSVFIYNPTTDNWSTGATMPVARAALYQVGQRGNDIFAMGGIGPGGVTPPQVDVYDVAKDSWSTLPATASMPDPRGEMGVVSHGGRIYTVGGAHPAFGTSTDTNAVLKP